VSRAGGGQPVLDGMGDWPPLLKLTQEQRAEYDRADAAFRERHVGCRAGRQVEHERPPGHSLPLLLPDATAD
jgi:hypothetical protein